MRHIRHAAAAAAIVLTLSSSLTGCSLYRQGRTPAAPEEVDVIDSIDELRDGGYYVLSNGKYQSCYVGASSFDMSKVSDTKDSKVLWFGDDWGKIPTMYEEDQLVFYTTGVLNEEFVLERYEDLGYTFGFCNLQKTGSGRYSLSTDPEDMTVLTSSSAEEILTLTKKSVIIEAVGKTAIRSGMVTRAGTVLGLTKNSRYSVDVYVGSELSRLTLRADSRALAAMKTYNLSDYTFLESKVLRIDIPRSLPTGYYLVNGKGLFRYVAGSSYDEDTDFNAPEEGKDGAGGGSGTVRSETVNVDKAGTYILTIRYSAGTDKVEPSASLVTGNAVYSFAPDGERTLALEADLAPGQYTVSISDIGTRTYTLSVTEKTLG